MSFLIPDFVPVPSAEAMQAISIVSLIVGICLVSVGLFLLFFNKQKAKNEMPQPYGFLWVVACCLL